VNGCDSRFLEKLWRKHRSLAETLLQRWASACESNERKLDEFFFCLLGGFGVPYELNRSAFSVLKQRGLLDLYLYRYQVEQTRISIERQLMKPQFLPRTSKGRLRRYRFPKRKSSLLASAGNWLWKRCQGDLHRLLRDKEELEKRQILLDCPGFGPKTATWFLRNIGYARDLAILDTHVYRTLVTCQLIDSRMNPDRHYFTIEATLRDYCCSIGARVGEIDILIWLWARGDLDLSSATLPIRLQ